jgi:hypothetical protein
MSFIDNVSSTPELDEGDTSEDSYWLHLARQFDDVYKEFLGEAYVQESDVELYKAATFDRNGKIEDFKLVTPDNFYFNPPEEVIANDDLPPDEQIVSSYSGEIRIGKFVHMINCDGYRVFYGDLTLKNIQNLQGTYYVMFSEDYVEMLEKSDITVEPNDLGYTPVDSKGMLIRKFYMDYVCTVSGFAVVGGKQVKNKLPYHFTDS